MNILAQLKTEDEKCIGEVLDLPVEINVAELKSLTLTLLNEDSFESSMQTDYSFFVGEEKIEQNLLETLLKINNNAVNNEVLCEITCKKERIFRVKAVSRCTSTLNGHTKSIVSAHFSSDSSILATGSGDCTVRLWDMNTETPFETLTGHVSSVLVVSWSPDGKKLVSGCRSGSIFIHIKENDRFDCCFKNVKAHKQWVNGVAWRPAHLDGNCDMFVSCSKDGTMIIFSSISNRKIATLANHTKSVTCVKWAGSDHIFSASQDCTIKMWDWQKAHPLKTFSKHAHWVNFLALNSEYVMRSGPYDFANESLQKSENTLILNAETVQKLAHTKFTNCINKEMLVSCSDDFTMILWDPANETALVARMAGHQQAINHVAFSGNGKLIASASFDKTVKLWNGLTGKYVSTLRGHVHSVFMVCWSSDNQMLASCSADSTVKVWDVKTGGILANLCGHTDQVFAIDWNNTGEILASGGRDALLKIWRS